MSLRKLIHTGHLWLGLISGTILFIVAITGSMLAFEDEIRDATEHDLLYVKPSASPRLGVKELFSALSKYDAKAKPTQLRFFGDNTKAAQVYTKDKKIYAINPYTAEVLGYRDQERDFMFVVLSLHRTLLMGHIGEEIIFWNVWIFLIMLLSGLFLWWPRRRKQLRQALTIKRNASTKRRNFDLHSVGGFYAFIPLLFIVITGIDMASGGAKQPQKKSTPVLGFAAAKGMYDSALHQAYHGEPVDAIRVNVPKDSLDVITISIRYATSNLRRQSNFAYDRYSLQPLNLDRWENKNLKQRFFGSDYEVHTGRVIGLPGKIIMFLAALIAASLPVTGFLMWNAKRRKQRPFTSQSVSILQARR